jgi:Domain of unknown function (DUF4386)
MTAHTKARIAGVLYVLTIAGGILALLIGRRFEVLRYATNLLADLSYAAATLLVYAIFKPVNKIVALLAALFALAAVAAGLAALFRLGTLPFHHLVLFGIHSLLLGWLIWRSTFLPRILGIAMFVVGIGWLTFLAPPLGRSLFPVTMISGFICQMALTLWLLVKGVDEQRWKEQAAS